MRHFLLTSLAAATLAFGAAGAMAQPAPVPNASGSQVTAPAIYRANAYQNRAQQPTMRKKMVSKKRMGVHTTGSVNTRQRAVPVRNASGSQVTSPETYGATAYQNRRR